MSLPSLIEILPLDRAVAAEITVPGSKSITNRALILAALAEGKTVLHGALWSEDTQVMVEALKKLGFVVSIERDRLEFCNRTITVEGMGGRIPNGGTKEKPLAIFVGNAGTAARFLAALVCLGRGVYRLHGVPRMHERPQAELFSALRELGYKVEAEKQDEKLPAILGTPEPAPTGSFAGTRACSVSIESSSQFASALLLCAASGGWKINVMGWNPEEAPYVTMTIELIKTFPKANGDFRIEPDASSGSYFLAANSFFEGEANAEHGKPAGKVREGHVERVSVANWPQSGWQIDERFPKVLAQCRAHQPGTAAPGSIQQGGGPNPALAQGFQISRARDLGDSIMMAIVLAPLSRFPVHFTELGRLRLQECERVVALRTELTKCGASVLEKRDTLEVLPSSLHAAEIETYEDHRMAMCFSILGLKVAGIKIKNPACVKKTFPNFFQKLAMAPPNGLGATVLDGESRKRLGVEDLFAD
jgi:3-phosphoshikimate 1-carboxyvinyltransferase